jgi:hypothetical protein
MSAIIVPGESPLKSLEFVSLATISGGPYSVVTYSMDWTWGCRLMAEKS